MEWEAVERRSENERLSAALSKLIDRNWSQDKKLDQALDRVRDLESRVEGTEALLKESHINQTALDVEVVGLQQRVTELESEMKWTRGIVDQHSASFDDFGAQVEELEAFVDRKKLLTPTTSTCSVVSVGVSTGRSVGRVRWTPGSRT